METAAPPNPPSSSTSSVARLAERLPAGTTLATIWAHPDDESYLGAGLMAAVADRGGRVVNVTASIGEHGTDNPTTWPPERLAAVRRRELTDALELIGADSNIELGIADGTCSELTPEMGARRVGVALDEIDPQIVVTFGPDGVTGHADHRAVAAWTARAVAARRDRIGLLTTAVAALWPDDLTAAMRRVDAFYPGYPDRALPRPVWAVRVRGDLLDRKLAALDAHQSQVGAMKGALGPHDYRRLASFEAYRAANQTARRLLSGAPARTRTAA